MYIKNVFLKIFNKYITKTIGDIQKNKTNIMEALNVEKKVRRVKKNKI